MANATPIAVYWRQLVRGEGHGLTAALARGVLVGISSVVAPGVMLRNLSFDRGWRTVHRVSVPVISIGNLTVGGTGKTPIVADLAQRLQRLGRKVGVLSRGYGSATGDNDEARVLRQLCPGIVLQPGPDRVALAHRAIHECGCDVLLLDDGLQHRRLHRALDIVLLDATERLAPRRLFPAGVWREHLSSLRRAHLAIITRSTDVPAEQRQQWVALIQQHHPSLPIVTASFASTGWTDVTGRPFAAPTAAQRIGAFCGIGNPTSFVTALRQADITPAVVQEFPDHHAYTPSDVRTLHTLGQTARIARWVTTLKDAVKLRELNLHGLEICCLMIEPRYESGADLIDERLRSVLTAE